MNQDNSKKVYDPKNIEDKWVKKWEDTKIYKTDTVEKLDKSKPKMHVLDMFPYPSGEGLHAGHTKIFSASDAYARMKRMQGYNVLHATGWDAFGLPAEQFAIKNKVNPKISTKKNTENFEKQMKMLGLSYDWARTVNTTDPKFYKWTQWIFKQLYKRGLCYESFEPINWCPSCKTGLANEDLEGGLCERCGSVVEKKPIRQWVIKITEYAEKLLKGVNNLDWKESIKEMQRNWIGESEGAEIDFKISTGDTFTVFTTRPDTLFGCTYCVFAPEHKHVKEYLEKNLITNKSEVEKYIGEAKNKTEIERSAEGKEKTGVKLKGIFAINPANEKQVPIYIADYVLGNYGTGAIMAVPAHDERDGEFADKYGIEKTQVVSPVIIMDGPSTPRNDENIRKFNAATAVVKHWQEDLFYVIDFGVEEGFPGGSLEDGETTSVAVLREVTEETGYKNIKSVKEILEHNYSRGYKPRKNIEELCHDGVFEVILENNERVGVVDEHTKNGSWKTKEEILNSKKITKHHKYYFDQYLNKKVFTDSGLLVNSGKFDGMDSNEAKKQITEFVGGKMVKKYKLRDWVFARQRYWGEPFPIVFDENHKPYLVADSELPVVLPDVESYEPTGTGEGPLADIKDWVQVRGFINKNGEFVSEKNYQPNVVKKTLQTLLMAEPEIKTFYRESNTMPQWAGSSWYWLRYLDPNNENFLVGEKQEKYWSSNGHSVDIYLGGMEHATRHLIYGRFWNIFLKEIGVLTHSEPFKRLEAVGLVLGEGGVKMSKRLGNVVNPDDMVAQFGADTLRLYIAFAASYHDSFAWDTKAIVGPRRFIERVWNLQYKVLPLPTSPYKGEEDLETLLNQTIKKVGEDYEKLQFNTAVAQMMIFVNAVEKVGTISTDDYKILLKLLAPLCPFFTEEIWHNLGEKDPIHISTWPKYDENKIINKTVNIAVQVNGKLRDVFTAQTDLDDASVIELAKETEGYTKWVGDAQVKKTIVVKNKIVNVII